VRVISGRLNGARNPVTSIVPPAPPLPSSTKLIIQLLFILGFSSTDRGLTKRLQTNRTTEIIGHHRRRGVPRGGWVVSGW